MANASPQSRWSITIWLSIAVLAASLAQYAAVGGVDGVRAVIRLTARTSLILFLLTFTASALARMVPTPTTQWLRRNRRYLGVAFAFSHLVHLVFIIIFWKSAPELFWQDRTPMSNIAPGITYVLIFAMAATSFDSTAKAIGPKAWKWLHLVGAYAIWISFAAAYGGRAVKDPFYMPFAIVVLLALVVRLAGRWYPRRLSSAPATE